MEFARAVGDADLNRVGAKFIMNFYGAILEFESMYAIEERRGGYGAGMFDGNTRKLHQLKSEFNVACGRVFTKRSCSPPFHQDTEDKDGTRCRKRRRFKTDSLGNIDVHHRIPKQRASCRFVDHHWSGTKDNHLHVPLRGDIRCRTVLSNETLDAALQEPLVYISASWVTWATPSTTIGCFVK